MEEAEYTGPVLDGDKNDVRVLMYEVGSLLTGLDRTAFFEGATVNPHNDRLLLRASLVGFPNVEVQAILSFNVEGGNLHDVIILGRTFPEVIRLVYAIVRDNVYRCFPAIFPDRLPAHKGNTFERNDIIFLFANKSTVNALDCQRLVIITVSNLPVLTVQRPHFLARFVQKVFLFTHYSILLSLLREPLTTPCSKNLLPKF